ncbi:MAG: hypothetical protein K2X99_09940, partial [Gemmatimonadaceae bacterium]|nr:hypothetical protein [Gemmatimonadaceae bacterium]
ARTLPGLSLCGVHADHASPVLKPLLEANDLLAEIEGIVLWLEPNFLQADDGLAQRVERALGRTALLPWRGFDEEVKAKIDRMFPVRQSTCSVGTR